MVLWLGLFLPLVGVVALAIFLIWAVVVTLYFASPHVLSHVIHRCEKKMLIVETVCKSAPHFDQLSLSLTFLFTLALPLYVQKFEERSCSSHNTPLEGWV